MSPTVRTTSSRYFDQPAIHGVRYLSANRGLLNRCFWLFSLLLAGACFAYCVYQLFAVRFSDRPILVSASERAEPIWHIPFPAVTFCPMVKSTAANLNFTELYHKTTDGERLTAEQDLRLPALLQLCDPHLSEGWSVGEDIVSYDELHRILNEIVPSLETVTVTSKVQSQVTNTSQIFRKVWTDEGLCFTYNTQDILNYDELDPEFAGLETTAHEPTNWSGSHRGYSNSRPANDSYPRRAHSIGLRGAFIVVLQQLEQHIDHICRGPTLGFKVMLHSPDEIPFAMRNFFMVPAGKETRVIVHPHVTEMADSLRSSSLQRRQCYFDDEKKLRFFRRYTQRNCELECVASYMQQKCGCTRYSLPRDSSVAVCGAKKIDCMDKAENELLDQDMLDGLSNRQTDCNCLPSCSHVSYEAEASSGDLNIKELHQAFKASFDDGSQMSRLTVMFKDSHFTPIKRYESNSNVEIVALFGGLVALFFGASILSIIEIFYSFVWLRIWRPRIEQSFPLMEQSPNEKNGDLNINFE